MAAAQSTSGDAPHAPPAAPAAGPRRLTPMLRQYLEAKESCQDAILMFRMGDFFELFFDDAKLAARELDITLTARDKGEDPIPMAGVPHHAVAGYIARLVERGHSVALCDQVEDPAQAKGIVRREITRLITPGTVCDLEALRPGSTAYLGCAQARADGGWSLGLLDLLAGELLCTELAADGLRDEVQRMGVRELLVPAACAAAARAQMGELRVAVRALPAAAPAAAAASADPAADRRTLRDRFGCDLVAGVADGGSATQRRVLVALVRFAEATQRRRLTHLQPPRAYRVADAMVLDESTRAALELCRTQMDGRPEGSLLWHLDRCRTAMGSRLLGHWLMFPARSAAAIGARLDAVGALRAERAARAALQEALAQVRDIERLAGRVALGRATPRDCGALRQSLGALPAVRAAMAALPGPLAARWREDDCAAPLAARLQAALVDLPPLVPHEGGIFRRGYCPELDGLLALCGEGHGFLADLERRERARSGIASLKVRYNRVFGYYLEVTRANLGQVPDDYVRKQTLVNAERYITPELKEFEEQVLHADARRIARETALLGELLAAVASALPALRRLARQVAETDVLAAFAQVADEGRYVRPTLVEAAELHIEAGRHPVLERLLPGGERFVPNDVVLGVAGRQLLLVTGPNMAGKSTVMRQTALITIMAHIGCFVPARRATVGLCDRLFTRVGAADDLGRGRSTFMVEMLEAAQILRHATARSLVLLDEVGRGTSTFDGVSLAWAIAEHLHDVLRCRAMFATHYHELAALQRPGIAHVAVAVAERDDAVVFLRRLVEGAASRSYGIEVARLAGVPEAVLGRARGILAGLEAGGGSLAATILAAGTGSPAVAAAARGAGAQDAVEAQPPSSASPAAPAAPAAPADGEQMALFATTSRPAARPAPSAVVLARLAACDPTRMTPLQALNTLAALKRLAVAAPAGH